MDEILLHTMSNQSYPILNLYDPVASGEPIPTGTPWIGHHQLPESQMHLLGEVTTHYITPDPKDTYNLQPMVPTFLEPK